MPYIFSHVPFESAQSIPMDAKSRRQTSLSAIFVICAAIGISVFAHPLAAERLSPANVVTTALIQDSGAESGGSVSLNSNAVPDSAFLLCNIATFSFGNIGGLGGSDVWGWSAPDGSEYAIVGTHLGLAFVNVTTLELVQTISGPRNGCPKFWRDMKTYQHYLYCVSECTGPNEGLMIIDLQFLPDSVSLLGTFDVSPDGDVTSHNMTIDTSTGFLYMEGRFLPNKAYHIYSLADPENPVFVSSFGPSGGFHDMFVHGDTAYVAEGFEPFFSIYDMSSKTSPVLLVRKEIPAAGYVHNIWPTPDRRHVVTTEETVSKTVKVWNIEDTANIQIVGEYLGPNGIAHNARIQGDTVYLSHYEAGVRLLNISDPAAPFEFASFDTFPGDSVLGFGCWGVYPYLPSGVIFASNRDGRLFILQELLVELGDTLTAADASGPVGTSFAVDVVATNSIAVRQLLIPFTWAGPLNLAFDSASTAGTRTELFENVALVSIDPFNKRAAFSLTSSTSGYSLNLQPGSGPVLKLYFTIPPGVPDTVNSISFLSFSGSVPQFSTDCQLDILPVTASGSVTIAGCCTNPGDANGDGTVNIADVTYLIARIFAGGTAPVCCEEGDANGTGSVNIADVTFLIARIFAGGPAPVCGPIGMAC